MTPQGEGKVIEVFPLRDAVLVDIPDVGRREFKREQINIETTSAAQNAISESNEDDTEYSDESMDILALVSGNEQYQEPEKKEKVSRQGKTDRKTRSERKDRAERGSGNEKTDRMERDERKDRNNRAPRPNRNQISEKNQKSEAEEIQ